MNGIPAVSLLIMGKAPVMDQIVYPMKELVSFKIYHSKRKGACRRLFLCIHCMLHAVCPHKELGIVYVRGDIFIVDDQDNEVYQRYDTEDPTEGEDVAYPGQGCRTEVKTVDTRPSQEKVQQDGCYEGLITVPELCDGAIVGGAGCVKQAVVG